MRSILQTARDRLALRRRVRIPCQVVEEEGFSLLADQCVDLSPRGMGVRAHVAAPVGTRVLVSFRIPGSPIYCDAQAHVTRVAWGRRREDDFMALGLSFVALEPTQRAILSVRLRGIPPPPPSRPVRIDYAESVRAIHAMG